MSCSATRGCGRSRSGRRAGLRCGHDFISQRGSSSLARVLKPLETFLHVESASGVVLLVAPSARSMGQLAVERLLRKLLARLARHFLINEALMTAFFFVVGLEIRREMHDGTLSSVRTAALPIAAALGGIVAPAAIYLLFNSNPDVRAGWAIPTATDIAFSVGVPRYARQARESARCVSLLLALAIADDVAAIFIIAFFYADGVGLQGVAIAAVGLAGLLLLRLSTGTRCAGVSRRRSGALARYAQRRPHPVLAGVIVGVVMPQAPADVLRRGCTLGSPTA